MPNIKIISKRKFDKKKASGDIRLLLMEKIGIKTYEDYVKNQLDIYKQVICSNET